MVWLKRITILIAVVAGLLVAALYGLSERRLTEIKAEQGFVAVQSDDAEWIARGQRIARTRGCFGCHGQQLEGEVFYDGGWWDRSVAPNLAISARSMSDAELEIAIRQGIGVDGRAFWSMPSYNFVHLSDSDLSALIAYLRTAEVVEAELPDARLAPQVRWWLITGSEDHMAGWVRDTPELITDGDDEPAHVRGEYLAMTTCNECHGLDLRGTIHPWGSTPDLAMVRAYSPEQFRALMIDGISLAGRDDLPLMSEVARDRFAAFSEEEIADLHSFLSSLVDRPVPQDVFWRIHE